VTAEAPALTSAAVAPPDAHGAAGHARGGISNPILGMILFITSEVMFFSGLFAAYFTVRAASPIWPPIVQGGPDAASKAAVVAVSEVLAAELDLHLSAGNQLLARLVRIAGVTRPVGESPAVQDAKAVAAAAQAFADRARSRLSDQAA